jgi:hypothetical protein
MSESTKINRNKLYMSLLYYKKPLQTIITNLMYNFKYKKKSINDFLEPQIQIIYKNLIDEFYLQFNINPKNFWEYFRFYLKGGKALNKLIKKTCIENKNKILSSTNEILKSSDKCFINRSLFFNTNTDYDFTMLIKDQLYSKINIINNLIINILNRVAINLEKNNEFIEWSEKFIDNLNKSENLTKIYKSLKSTQKDMDNEITQNKIKDHLIKNYFILKIQQIEKFNQILKSYIDQKKNFFTNPTVGLTYSIIPIKIDIKDDLYQEFYLYRLKLFVQPPMIIKKLNKDIKDFLIGSPDIEAIPFDNIFGELIDISLQIGDKQTINEIWKSTGSEYILHPTKYIDDISKSTFVFNYPIVSLKYQLKDVIFIFNVPNPQKLSKRCERFIEYIKMFCYIEEIPDKFSIIISDELQQQIQNELKSKNRHCYNLINILNFLSENQMKENEFIINKSQLETTFPEFCKNKYKKNFIGKHQLINNILQLKGEINIDKEILQKVNYLSLKDLFNMRDNIENFKEILERINEYEPISRIIPIELDI